MFSPFLVLNHDSQDLKIAKIEKFPQFPPEGMGYLYS